ncbi:hypothetical protein N0V90_013186 [Kalmusia sp. IMI 367209]|nr:hypothetical protein N0V90_013186 [Kalmusia sp. IMI 367209]
MGRHFLVFGGTGAAGSRFIPIALEKGHHLTIYARSPEKLPASTRSHERVKIIQGTFDNLEKLEEAASCGADVFVSFAGPEKPVPGQPIKEGYERILPLLALNGVRRVFILGTNSIPDPADKRSLKWALAIWMIKLIARHAYEEIVAIGDLVRSQPVEELRWTLFRVGFLNNGPAAPVNATYPGSGKDHLSISRDSIAEWLLKEAQEDKWVGKSPYICNS